MKIVKPGSYQEWLEWRMGGIGSSDAGAIMGVSKWLTKVECWALKTERMFPKPANYQMRRGLALEPFARKEHERQVGVEMPPACAESTQHPFLLTSLDGLSLDQTLVGEYKCPGTLDHRTAKAGKVPKHYVWQLVHHLAVTELPFIDYVSYRDRVGVRIRFDRDEKLEAQYLEEARKFWKCVVLDTQPDETSRHRFVDDSRVFKVRRSR